MHSRKISDGWRRRKQCEYSRTGSQGDYPAPGNFTTRSNLSDPSIATTSPPGTSLTLSSTKGSRFFWDCSCTPAWGREVPHIGFTELAHSDPLHIQLMPPSYPFHPRSGSGTKVPGMGRLHKRGDVGTAWDKGSHTRQSGRRQRAVQVPPAEPPGVFHWDPLERRAQLHIRAAT